MNILVVSPLAAGIRTDARGVPCVGDQVYHYGSRFVVKEVVWWPTEEVLLKFDATWCGCHVSELTGSASVEAILIVDNI